VAEPDRFHWPIDDGAADHPEPGRELPPVVLPATDGSGVCLAELPGQTVVVIYPWTGRPGHPDPPNWDEIPGAHGSTPELEGFRDSSAAIADCGARIFGLSRQTTAYQSKMAARLGLPFPILSDADGRFTAALGLPSFATGGEIYLKRLTLLIADGRMEMVFYPVSAPALHASEVLLWLQQQRER
jgi:peroxiredoxin